MSNDAMDIDSDDLASLAKLETLDGTTLLTGSTKQTTYVPINIVPNATLGESYKTCGVEGIKFTEYQLKLGLYRHGSYRDVVNNSGSLILSYITSTGDTSGDQVTKTLTDVFVQSPEFIKALNGVPFSGIGIDTYRDISLYYSKLYATCQGYPFMLEVFVNAKNHPFSRLTGKPSQRALWPFELQLLIFSEECRAKMQTPRYDHETYVRNKASIGAGTCITTFSPAEIKLAEETTALAKNGAGRMASAIEFNRLRNVHDDPANPGVNSPAQSPEIAKCNSQSHGEEVMMATPAVAPFNTAVATAFLGPKEYFDYNDRPKSATCGCGFGRRPKQRQLSCRTHSTSTPGRMKRYPVFRTEIPR